MKDIQWDPSYGLSYEKFWFLYYQKDSTEENVCSEEILAIAVNVLDIQPAVLLKVQNKSFSWQLEQCLELQLCFSQFTNFLSSKLKIKIFLKVIF